MGECLNGIALSQMLTYRGSLFYVSYNSILQFVFLILVKSRGGSVVEQMIRNHQVVGSSPTLGSRNRQNIRYVRHC